MLLTKSLGLSLASSALGHIIRSEAYDDAELGNWCGTDDTIVSPPLLNSYRPRRKRQGQETIVVPTYFHVVTNSTRPEDGWLSDELLQAQLDVLNSDFDSTGISFDLISITRLVHEVWGDSADESDHLAMKTDLREGDYKTLNLYFRTFVGYSGDGDPLLGSCYLPQGSVEPGTEVFNRDGCMIRHGTVPGGSMPPYNLGRTGTHEVGHWLGLHHTFRGGCEGSGDLVDDTPPQGNATRGCPQKGDEYFDTCEGGDPDPIHNHMNYSAHDCRNEFTPGQVDRMHEQWGLRQSP
ncbi:hypothetical protein MFIFM68171_01752 [Madurella fahalii]|uniref:Peptidase M43 pregnancy-associated plasma-A domain-containing protein n=1 Tax=Madurella fahalii TaxID=1157608 RepID=A0ABQ0G1A5_9PEZI